MTTSGDYQVFEAGDVLLQSGVVFASMRLAYKTYGTLNARKDNVIVYPTSFSAQHFDTEWLIQPGGILDPERYFIVIPNLFGNGLSSSPSNTDVTPSQSSAACWSSSSASQRSRWSMAGRWAACRPITGRPAIPTWWNVPLSCAGARDALPIITCSWRV
jgi:homoserine O-acetyltransferase